MELIPYGLDELSVARLEEAEAIGAKRYAPLAFPCAPFDRRQPRMLRFNTAWYDAVRLAEWGDRDDKIAAIEEYLCELSSPWDMEAKRLARAYVAFVAEIIETNRTELEALVAPFVGLYQADDWFFSSPHPMPRAHLYAPAQDRDGERSREDFIRVPFAFLLDGRLVAAVSDSGLMPRARKERAERLARAGADVVNYGGADLADGGRKLFGRILGPDGLRFWSGETVPTGLVTPALLDF